MWQSFGSGRSYLCGFCKKLPEAPPLCLIEPTPADFQAFLLLAKDKPISNSNASMIMRLRSRGKKACATVPGERIENM